MSSSVLKGIDFNYILIEYTLNNHQTINEVCQHVLSIFKK